MKRTYDSGYQKKKKRDQRQEFISKLPKLSSFFTPPGAVAAAAGPSAEEQPSTSTGNIPAPPAVNPSGTGSASIDAIASIDVLVCPQTVGDDAELEVSVSPSSSTSDVNNNNDRQCEPHICVDDPALWPELLTDRERCRCSLVRRGPVQVKDQEFPQNDKGRRFTKANYYIAMKNGESVNRSWLVYSESADRVFCFCCRLFGKQKQQLSEGGFNDWKNLAFHLINHERSEEHRKNADSWQQLSHRLETKNTIDSQNQDIIEVEAKRWNEILTRLVAIINFLSERNLPLRGHSDKLHEPGNGNFLGQVQLMAQFDPVMCEHLRRIKVKEAADTYLSSRIQNELVSLVAKCTTDAIVQRVRKAKYFSVIMDCTPDLSHNEQLSVVLRIVNCDLKKGIAVHEHFVGFLVAHDTTGKGLFELFLGHLETLGLELANCRGQSYDNGSNMQGKHQGVQKRVLDVNSKALCVPCGSHTLNLVVGDAAKSSVASVSFFGLLQRLYTLFSSSVNRWTILRDHVKTFTVKALSTTRWECRIEAVKAVRYQLPDILKALTALEDHAKEKRDAEVASSAGGIIKEMQTWPFLVSTIAWYNVLYQINKISKLLQSPSVSVATCRREITTVTGYLEEFREIGFNSVKTDAREIAEEIQIEMSWPEVRKRRTKKQFDYEGGEETHGTAEESFKREVFLPLVDTALITVKERFSHMETFFQLYGFLYSKDLMKSTKEAGRLGECCHKLEQATEDVEAQDLRMEVEGAVQSFPTDISTPSEMLNYIYKENIVDLYPNLSIALRLLLTLPVTVASGERSFSKLKLIKTYLRTTMTQERLSSLAVLSIEQEMRRSLDMKDVIARFADAKARKVKF